MAFDLKKSLSGMSQKLKIKRSEISDNPKKKFSTPKINLKKLKPKLVIAVLAAIVVLFLGTMGVGIYAFNWEDNFTKSITKVVPYPAAIVNGRVVLYRSYLEQLVIVEKYQREFKNVDFESADGQTVLTQLRKETMTRLVEDAIVRSEAAKLDVSVSDKELTDSFNQLVKSNGGEESFSNTLKKYYGLTPSEFKTEIYKSTLLRQKMDDKFSTDESLNSDAKAKAEEILGKVKAGEDFAALAKQYSQDSTASSGGDLGFFAKGKMVPEFETAAFALKVNEVSDVVKTVYGYHIIKVTEIKDDEIRASHILIKTKSFSDWLDEAVSSAKKTILIKNAK